VFLGFAADPDVTVKTIGVGMAAAVLIDATLVRLVLAPAAMVLLGRAGWWLPGALVRRWPGTAPDREALPDGTATAPLADSGEPVTTG
jgi:putative drug exporter of the RND superfamily